MLSNHKRCVPGQIEQGKSIQCGFCWLLLYNLPYDPVLRSTSDSCSSEDAEILDAVFVSRPSDLSDLEDILPSLDDVLGPQADFASDSELPLWDSMLTSLSCPGMQSLSDQIRAPSMQAGTQGLEQSSTKGMPQNQVDQPSPSNSACSCDAQVALDKHVSSQQGSRCSQAKTPQQQRQQEQVVRVLDDPTSSRDSNPACSSPDTAQDKGGSGKKRKMDDSDEDCSHKHPSSAIGRTQVHFLLEAHSSNA